MNIKVFMKNGEIVLFKHEGRAGGSYTKELRYEGSFAIITDEYGNTTSFPSSDIEKITTTPSR